MHLLPLRVEEIADKSVGDDSKGYFVKPTVIVTKDPKSVSMTTEIFGPVLTVRPNLIIKLFSEVPG